MPTDGSALRQRLKVRGHHWCMIAIEHPQRTQLATSTPHIFDIYTDYILGERVMTPCGRAAEALATSSMCAA
eukprot:14277815-Heterocapsa_arctica.AAC.1